MKLTKENIKVVVPVVLVRVKVVVYISMASRLLRCLMEDLEAMVYCSGLLTLLELVLY